ncbi:MAG: hypothetical protein LBR84_00530 [Tannerella sp.]|nr:hypothetical protein [Tannerella sp.]
MNKSWIARGHINLHYQANRTADYLAADDNLTRPNTTSFSPHPAVIV